MFYVLIVYENGTTQMVHIDSYAVMNETVDAAEKYPETTFVQWGAWPFGPVFGTREIEGDRKPNADLDLK